MSQVFISYARKDLAVAEKIISALVTDDLEPWIDWKHIPKGKKFEGEIMVGIEQAEIFLFLVSPDSGISEWCNKEITHAANNGKRILPIVIYDTDLKVIPPEILKHNWVYCRDRQDNFNNAIEEIRTAIHTDYDWLKYHTELQVKALKWEQRKDNSRLLRGKELREAEVEIVGERDSDNGPLPTLLQRRYVIASRKSQSRLEKFIGGTILAVLLTILMIIAGWSQSNIANANKIAQQVSTAQYEIMVRSTVQAQRDEQLKVNLADVLARSASQMLSSRDGSPELSVLLSIESIRLNPNLQAKEVLLAGVNLLPTLLKEYLPSPDAGILASYLEVAPKYSHDGKLLLIIENDRNVRIWDVASGRELAELYHEADVISALFSQDDKQVITGSTDGVIRIWDAVTGSGIRNLGIGKPIIQTAFSTNGQWLAVVTEDNKASVWDINSWKKVLDLGAEQYYIKNVAFSNDTTKFAFAGRTSLEPFASFGIKLIDTNGWKEIAETQAWIDGGVRFSFSSTDRFLMYSDTLIGTGAFTEYASIYDIQNHTELYRFENLTWNGEKTIDNQEKIGVVIDPQNDLAIVFSLLTGGKLQEFRHDDVINSATLSPDGRLLLTTSNDHTARLWDVTNGQELYRIVSESEIVWGTFSPEGSNFLTVSANKIQIWAISSSIQTYSEVSLSKFYQPVFSNDGKHVAIFDGSLVHVIDVITGEEEKRFTSTFDANSMVYDPTDDFLYIATNNPARIVKWDVRTGRQEKVFSSNQEAPIFFSPNGKIAVIETPPDPSNSGMWAYTKYVVFDLESKQEISSIYGLYQQHPVFSLDGTVIATAEVHGLNRDWKFHFWETNTGKEVFEIENAGMHANYYGLSRDGRWFFASTVTLFGGSGQINVWDISGQHLTSQIEYPGELQSASFDIKGDRLITATENRAVIVWDVMTGQAVGQLSHNQGVKWASFSTDSTLVITYTMDGTIHIWDMKGGNETMLLPQMGSINYVSFSPDATRYVTVSDNSFQMNYFGIEDLIPSVCDKLTRNLTFEEWKRFIPIENYRATCPDIPLDPIELLEAADDYVLSGNSTAAAAFLAHAVVLVVGSEDAYASNQICWFGSIDGFANIVLPACEHAVQLDSENGLIRDSRGLARALLGNFKGAIDDFSYFVDYINSVCPESSKSLCDSWIAKRLDWIEQMEAGQNPFNTETLLALRSE